MAAMTPPDESDIPSRAEPTSAGIEAAFGVDILKGPEPYALAKANDFVMESSAADELGNCGFAGAAELERGALGDAAAAALVFLLVPSSYAHEGKWRKALPSGLTCLIMSMKAIAEFPGGTDCSSAVGAIPEDGARG